MYAARLKSNFASVLAFGHMSGMGRSSHRKHQAGRAKAKPVLIEEPSMTAEQMGVTFENCPELWRAIHPIFGGQDGSRIVENGSTGSRSAAVLKP
jgi:hypothetical protein